MVELSSEEEAALRDLIDAHERGERAGAVISQRLLENSSRKGPDGRPSISYHDMCSLYDGLVEKGLIDGYFLPGSSDCTYEDLTSAGRCYFKDKAAAEKQERKQIWSDRRFQIGLSVGTMVGSALLSLTVSLAVHVLTA